MQILIDVSASTVGRLVGTVASAGDAEVRPFSGSLELLARIEELCRPEPASPGDDPEPHDQRSE
jgi:hypothetical protein